MLDIIDNYLGTACTPELRDVIRHADKTIKKISNYDFDGYFEELLMTDETRDAGDTVFAIVQGYTVFVDKLLKEHGAVFIRDTPLEMLSKILEGVTVLPSYGNVDELHAAINAGMSPTETFATLINTVSSVAMEEIMIHTSSISTGLINRIMEVTDKKEETEITEEEVLVRGRHVKALREFSGFVQREELDIVKMVKDGMPVGYPFKVYVSYIGRRLEQMTPERIAHELYAMALCSVDGINNPRSVIGININDYIADLSTITKVDIIVNDLMVKLNQ